MSKKQIEYLNHIKKQKIFIKIIQVSIAILFFIIWEVMAKLEIINSFITSSPTEIIKTIFGLFKSGELFHHIWVTLSEALIAFFIVGIVSTLISIILYENKTLSKIVDPYLTILNSLPKVALGPILIIWIGANKKSIILMAVLISIIVSIQSITVGFKNTNKSRIKILKSFGANEWEILRYVVIPSNYKIILNAFKINIGLCLIGIVMGEFLTSKAGVGYLILYGSQVFNLTLVMSGIIILLILSLGLYSIVSLIEKHLDY